MLTIGSFFDLTDFPDQELFADCAYVWGPLKKLRAYVASQTAPTFQHVCITDGVPLDSPYIFFNGKLRNARECIITYGDTTKGGLSVWENGQFLEGASVIMAGAVMVGKNIIRSPSLRAWRKVRRRLASVGLLVGWRTTSALS